MTVESEASQEKIRIVVNLTTTTINCIDLLVRQGVYMSRQDVIRDSIRCRLESRKIPPFFMPEPKGESA